MYMYTYPLVFCLYDEEQQIRYQFNRYKNICHVIKYRLSGTNNAPEVDKLKEQWLSIEDARELWRALRVKHNCQTLKPIRFTEE